MRHLLGNARLRFVMAACAGMVAADAAVSADLGSGPSSTAHHQSLAAAGWTLHVTPYGWLPFLNGDITVRGRTAEVDVTPIEVLEHLDMAWMSYIEARRGPLSLYNDIFYAKLEIEAGDARVRDRASLNASLGIDYEQAVIEVGAAYEVARWVTGGSVKEPDYVVRKTALDILAGARYWHQDIDLRLRATAALDVGDLDVSGTRARARSGGVDWVDPLVGLRLRHQWAPGQELVLRGDVGGFDAGSQISWQVVGAYSWDFAARDGILYSGVLGYRALYVDYEQGSGRTKYEYDVLQHGPIVGLTAKF